MNRLQVLDCGGTAKVKEVPSDADVASTAPFPRSDVCEGMFHGCSFAEQGPTRTSLLKSPELLLVSLVVRDRDCAAAPGCRLCALCAQRTSSACLWVERN